MWLGSGAGKVPLNNTKSGPVRFIGRGTDFGVDRGEGVPLPADRRERLDRICRWAAAWLTRDVGVPPTAQHGDHELSSWQGCWFAQNCWGRTASLQRDDAPGTRPAAGPRRGAVAGRDTRGLVSCRTSYGKLRRCSSVSSSRSMASPVSMYSKNIVAPWSALLRVKPRKTAGRVGSFPTKLNALPWLTALRT